MAATRRLKKLSSLKNYTTTSRSSISPGLAVDNMGDHAIDARFDDIASDTVFSGADAAALKPSLLIGAS